MSALANTSTGEFATSRGQPTADDISYIADLLTRFPPSAVSVMSGRSISYVERVAAWGGAQPLPRNTYRRPEKSARRPPSTKAKPTTREWRKDMPKAVQVVIQAVASKHGLTLDDLVAPASKTNARRRGVPRQEAYAAVYAMPHHATGKRLYGFPLIGSWFGGRDHTTILHGVRRHKRRLEEAAKT